MTFDFGIILEMLIPQLVLCCLCVGYIMKKWLPLDDKFIPTILFILGAVVSGFLNGWTLESITAGMLSALASTGLHQLFKQYMKLDEYMENEIKTMGPGIEDETFNKEWIEIEEE